MPNYFCNPEVEHQLEQGSKHILTQRQRLRTAVPSTTLLKASQTVTTLTKKQDCSDSLILETKLS